MAGLSASNGLSVSNELASGTGLSPGNGLSYQGSGGPPPPITNGFLQEGSTTSFIMLEGNVDYLLQE
jgi:hypothetical protein